VTRQTKAGMDFIPTATSITASRWMVVTSQAPSACPCSTRTGRSPLPSAGAW
jgi:hypothetical protein